MRRLLFVCSLLALLLAPVLAEAPEAASEVRADLAASYRQGEAGVVRIEVRYPAPAAFEGVLFLNVVERDPARNWPQAAHRIFAAAAESPQVFRVVQGAQALAEGLSTTLEFRLRANAPPGPYALVIQLYRGRQTNPNRVRVEDRVLLKGFDFEVVAQ